MPKTSPSASPSVIDPTMPTAFPMASTLMITADYAHDIAYGFTDKRKLTVSRKEISAAVDVPEDAGTGEPQEDISIGHSQMAEAQEAATLIQAGMSAEINASTEAAPPVATEDSRRKGKEKATTDTSTWECGWNAERQTLTLKQNTRQRYVEDFNPSVIPASVTKMLMHAEDLSLMENKSSEDLGHMQAHLSVGCILMGKHLSDRCISLDRSLHRTIIEKQDLERDVDTLKAEAAQSEKAIASMNDLLKKEREDKQRLLDSFESKRVTADDEIHRLQRLVSELQEQQRQTEHRLRSEMEAAKSKDKAQHGQIIELERALKRLGKEVKNPEVSKEQIIAEYKKSKDFQYQMKDFGLYGFDLLKRAIQRDGKMPPSELGRYDYDSCVIEDARDQM